MFRRENISAHCLEGQIQEEFVLVHFVWGMSSVRKCPEGFLQKVQNLVKVPGH